MRRFFSVLTASFVVLTLSCIVAILIGHNQPEISFIPELQRCGDSLCYLGILPGTTPWDEGMNIVRHTPQLKMSYSSETLFTSTNPPYAVGFLPLRIDAAGTPLWDFVEIDLNLTPSDISAGAVIAELGSPCYIASFDGNLILGWKNAAFTLPSAATSFSSASPVTHVVLRRPRPVCPGAGPTYTASIYKWQGFRRYR